MRKKPEKSKEQKIAENFFPMNPTDAKITTEKPYKRPLSVELPNVSKGRKKRSVKKKRKTIKKKISALKYEPPKISLKKGKRR